VRQYLQDFQQRPLPAVVPRELGLPESRRIVSLVGPRRCGKTFLLFGEMRSLLDRGIPKDRIVYLNFEDVRLADLRGRDLLDVLNLHWELLPRAAGHDLHIFLDEPQSVQEWERGVRSIHDSGAGRVRVTGSSSKLLGREIATALRGRTITYTLLPYSFREFLGAKGVAEATPDSMSSRDEARVRALATEYLDYGGFPEIAGEPEATVRQRMLRDYQDLVMYRDVVERHGVRNLFVMKTVMRILLSSFAREFSVNSVYSTIRSQGIRISKNTVYDYVSYVEDALAVFIVRKWVPSAKVRELSIPKVYLADTGFASLSSGFSEDQGRKLENAVFLELERSRGLRPLIETCFWKGASGREVDFVVREGPRVRRLVQACHSLSEKSTKRRELAGLEAARRALKCNDLTIVTREEEGREPLGGRQVEVLPLWKWLLRPR
jgi:hypothetical protein